MTPHEYYTRYRGHQKVVVTLALDMDTKSPGAKGFAQALTEIAAKFPVQDVENRYTWDDAHVNACSVEKVSVVELLQFSPDEFPAPVEEPAE